MRVAELVSKRFRTVERPPEPTVADHLRGSGEAHIELSPAVREGLEIQARLSASREADANAQWLAAEKAKRDADARYDAALLRRIAAR